jgi:hypothetical protein
VSRLAASTYVVLLTALLWLLRAQLVTEVGTTFAGARVLGLGPGMLLDFAGALVVTGAAVCAARVRPSLGHVTATGLSLVLLGFSAANVTYFGYFDARLEPWVIRAHLRDLPAIAGSVRSLVALPIVFAGGMAVPILLLVLRRARWHARAHDLSARCGAAFIISAIALGYFATVVKYTMVDGSSILAEQVFVSWIEDRYGLLPHAASRQREIERSLREATDVDPAAPARVLAAFRDWRPTRQLLPRTSDTAGASPLVRELAADPAHAVELRTRLGLPADGPIHVIVLFLESVRAFEMEHPALGPQVFPRTRVRLARQGLRFPTAYASTPDVGKTVQGQFATLCSLLPNFGEAAVYTSHPYLQVKSLAAVARDHGYHTLWISGGEESFHNKRVFESLHGTDRFFGFEYLQGIPYAGTQSACGYPDGPMLQEAVRLMVREASDGRPVFANILTLSTHHPVSEIPEGPLPAALRAAARERPAQRDYVGYLSRLRYLDESLEQFFTTLFASSLGGRTLVVVLGDHGQRYRSHLPVGPHQVVELMARVPFAIVTKHLPTAGVIRWQVHQVDVAPTVAAVAGFRGRVAWIGRNVLNEPGSPWVVAEQDRLHYRVNDRACYTLQGGTAPTCYRIDASTDPLLTSDLPVVATDLGEIRFLESVAIAARQAVTLNLVMPR